MPLTLPLITAGFAGSKSNSDKSLPLAGRAIWTERVALPYKTLKVAPTPPPGECEPVFTVVFPVDTIISIASSPDATTGTLYFVPALEERTYYAQPGDKLAAVAAGTLSLPIITCGFVGSKVNTSKSLPLLGRGIWTERGVLPYITNKNAPTSPPYECEPAFTVIFPVDTLVTIGAAPDPVNGPFHFVPALVEKAFYAAWGDKLAAKPA